MPTPFAAGANSLVAFGTAAAPAANAVVAGLTPPAGWYQVSGVFVISGAAEPQALNLQLNANNANLIKFPTGAGITGVVPFTIPALLVNGTNQVALTAVANATASTVYTASLTLTTLAD